MTQIIKETQDYILCATSNAKGSESEDSYQIRNKQYGIIELDTQILPQALKFVDDLQVALDAIRDMGKTDGKKVVQLSSAKPTI